MQISGDSATYCPSREERFLAWVKGALPGPLRVAAREGRALIWRALWEGRNGGEFKKAEGSMAKLKAGEVAVKVTEQAIQICGGYGYIRDFPVEKWHRDAKIYTLFEGTSEIQRLVIARDLLR